MAKAKFVMCEDGVRIAYDVTGSGPALMLLHGGGDGHSRLSWDEAGYVDRLKDQFKVITIDARGFGESDHPENAGAYAIDRMCQDILDVADAIGVEEFIVWGYSYGGNIGRFLATRAIRVKKLIVIGIPFGLAAPGEFREFILDFTAKWGPILQAHQEGTLDLNALDLEDREDLEEVNMAVFVAWLTAMLDWGKVEPADLQCPTFWISGTENAATMASIQENQSILSGTLVATEIFNGLNHRDEFFEIETVFPSMLDFTIG